MNLQTAISHQDKTSLGSGGVVTSILLPAQDPALLSPSDKPGSFQVLLVLFSV